MPARGDGERRVQQDVLPLVGGLALAIRFARDVRIFDLIGVCDSHELPPSLGCVDAYLGSGASYQVFQRSNRTTP